MSRKIVGNRKFLEEQVKTLLEYDPEENERNPPAPEEEYEEDLGSTDKLPGDEMLAAVNVDALELSDPVEAVPIEAIVELLKTIFFGMKSSREQIIQRFSDDFRYGGSKLSNIHKALDKVKDITAFEAFVFRFAEIEFDPNRGLPDFNIKWKSQIFNDIKNITNEYMRKIWYHSVEPGYEEKVKELYKEFMDKAYEEVYQKYKLSDELSEWEEILDSPFIFGSMDPSWSGPMKLTSKPSEETILKGQEELIKVLKNYEYRRGDNSELESIDRQSLQNFLEQKLTQLSIPMSTAKNPVNGPIVSFEHMKRIAMGQNRYTGKKLRVPISDKKLNSDRILAAIALREQSEANKNFIPLAIAFADVLLSIIGGASLVFGLPGFLRFVATLPIRGLSLIGREASKKFMKDFTLKYRKTSSPKTFLVGMSELSAGLGVTFAQSVRDIDNRRDRAQKLHAQFFKLLEQKKENPERKSYSYIKKDVQSYDYTLGQFNKLLDTIKNIFSSSGDDLSKSEIKSKLNPQHKDYDAEFAKKIANLNISKSVDEDDMQVVDEKDLKKVLEDILGSVKDSTFGASLDSPVQTLDAISPFTGSSIMQSWRDIYTLMIDVQLSSVLYSVKPGDRERITSKILKDSGGAAQKEYEKFMKKIEGLYNTAKDNAMAGLEYSEQKDELDLIYNDFASTVALLKKQQKQLELEISNKFKPALINMQKNALPYLKDSIKKEIRESMINEQNKPGKKKKKKKPRGHGREKITVTEIGETQEIAGHTITIIKAPKGATKLKKPQLWINIKHPDFKSRGFMLTQDAAERFIHMRKLWTQKGGGRISKLIPNNTFRPQTKKDNKGNHQKGIGLDLITPRTREKKREFIQLALACAWNSGFSGFGLPVGFGGPNMHIDTRADKEGPDFWLYDKDTKNEIGGDEKWDYKGLELDWFVNNVLANTTFTYIMSTSDMGKAYKQKHANALKKFKEPDDLSDSLERGMKKLLKKYNLEGAWEVAKKWGETIKNLPDEIKKADDFLKKESEKLLKDLGKDLTRAGSYLDDLILKSKKSNLDALADKKFLQKSFESATKTVEGIEDIEDLVREYAGMFGLTRPNVSGRLSVVRKYARDLNNPNLGIFYQNKNKEFDYNILTPHKKKKIAAAKNKLKEQRERQPSEIDFSAEKKRREKAEEERFQALKKKIASMRRGGPLADLKPTPSGGGFKDKVRQTSQIDFADPEDVLAKAREKDEIAKQARDAQSASRYGVSGGGFADPNVPQTSQINIDPEELAKSQKTQKGLEAVPKSSAEGFLINLALQFYLRDKVVPPAMEKYEAGKIYRLRLDSSKEDSNGKHLNKLENYIKKIIADYVNTPYNKVPITVKLSNGNNMSMIKPKDWSRPLNVRLYFEVSGSTQDIKQLKDEGFDFNSKKAQNIVKAKIQEAISSIIVQGGNEIGRIKRAILQPHLEKEKEYYFKMAGKTEELDMNNDEDADTWYTQTKVFGGRGLSSREVSPYRKFSNKPSLRKVGTNFSRTKADIKQVDAETESNPYEVSEFEKRNRLVEYVPADLLKFSSENIFTVTFDLPGNGFEQFLGSNPTVVRGRVPFDKSAPGEREADRRMLLAALKRNLDLFKKFLAKLESLPRNKIEFGRYSMQDFRIYKEYFESYIRLFSSGISAIESGSTQSFDAIVGKSYAVNLMSAALYNL